MGKNKKEDSSLLSGWQTLSLREAGVALIDCDHRTPSAAASGYPYVAIPQLKQGRLDLTDVRRITRAHFLEWTRKAKPQPYDVILSRRCNPGETAFVPPDLECALGQNLVLLRADSSKVFPPFLRWLVRSPAWWEQVGTFINVGAVFDSLKCADIPNFQLSFPPLHQQKAIAAVLGALDDKIELNRQMNATLEALAQALFKSWFVDFDPVKAKAAGRAPEGMDADTAALFPSEFQESELGPIPKGWQYKSLGNIADVSWGDTNTTKSAYVADGFPTYSASGQDGFLPYFDFDKTGVVVSAIGANSGLTWLATGKWSCIKNTLRFWAKDESVSTEYLYLFTLGKDKWPLRGSAQPFISQTDSRLMRILVPANSLAKIYGEVIAPYHTLISQYSGQSKTLSELRDALLPKLISGQLRLHEVERLLEAM